MNHLVHVLWEEPALPQAAKKLKDIIRATLPRETVLEDE
jgi:hypothetical protein